MIALSDSGAPGGATVSPSVWARGSQLKEGFRGGSSFEPDSQSTHTALLMWREGLLPRLLAAPHPGSTLSAQSSALRGARVGDHGSGG